MVGGLLFLCTEGVAIEYELESYDSGSLEVWVENQVLCKFLRQGEIYQYKWNLLYIVEWLYKNKDHIQNELEFPLPVEASTSLEFYNRSGEFDSEDMDEFDEWYEKRQEWYFRHSWYSNRGGSYLPEVLFRRVSDKIEIEWDNSKLYQEVSFINPKGIAYVNVNFFQKVIDDFINDYFEQMSNYPEGNEIVEKLKSVQ